jgi:hypothetical protein
MRRVLPLLVLLVTLAAAPAAAQAKLPKGFLGVQADGPLFNGQVDVNAELDAMKGAGVQSIRTALYWDLAQPYATAAEVPPDQAPAFTDEAGTPTNWSTVDGFVAATAARGLRLLPTVQRAPAWARLKPSLDNSPPSVSGRAAYARFLTALVKRYGPAGTFWAAHPEVPKLPITQWQVWNEPDGVRDWSEQPGLAAYVKLLKPAYKAVHAADPKAEVVAAGLVGRSWEHLGRLYRLGARKSFDAAAIHPFSLKVSNVLKILRLSRATMKRYGDARKPLVVSELSWPSAKGRTKQQYGFETTEKGQAAKLREAVPAIVAKRKAWRIQSLFWSTWLSYDRDPTYSFDYAGLRRFAGGQVIAKPAFAAFSSVARKLER